MDTPTMTTEGTTPRAEPPKTKAEEGLNVIFGTGPVGCATARALLEQGKRVRLVNRTGKYPSALKLKVSTSADPEHEGLLEIFAADATKPADAIAAADGVVRLYHCANPLYHQWAEILPLLQNSLIAAARAHGCVFVASEPLYMYAKTSPGIDETTRIDPPSRKGRIRQALHETLVESGREYGLPWVTIRASDYYGPGAEAQSVFGVERFLAPLAAGKRVSLLGDSATLHSYTYIEDFGRALALAAYRSESWGQAWIVPNASATTTQWLGERFVVEMERLLRDRGRRPELRSDFGRIPRMALRLAGLFNPVIREVDEMLYQKIADYVVDGSAFERAFGLHPTDLEQGVTETVQWFLATRDEAA